MVGEPRRRWGRPNWVGPPLKVRWSVEVGEVLTHGIVAVQDGGVCVGGDPVDDGVGKDLLFHPVVPLTGRQLGAEDRRGLLVAPVDQSVELLDLGLAGWGEEPVVDDQQLHLDQCVEAAFLVPETLSDAEAVEQFEYPRRWGPLAACSGAGSEGARLSL